MKQIKNKYAPPRVQQTAEVRLEMDLLVGSSPVQSSLIIEGQGVDGYYESDDLSSDWD
jgi:hypothetical protein